MEKRTQQQNEALHVYFRLLADALNEAGFDQKKVITVDIPWDSRSIKEWIWKPIQRAQLVKESTKELTTDEVSKVYETVNRLTAEKFGISIPFPSNEEQMLQDLENYI